MRRHPTPAMRNADERRIEMARKVVANAWDAAIVGCPHDMGCGTWLAGREDAIEVRALRAAEWRLRNEEDRAIQRGTYYRTDRGSVYPIHW